MRGTPCIITLLHEAMKTWLPLCSSLELVHSHTTFSGPSQDLCTGLSEFVATVLRVGALVLCGGGGGGGSGVGSWPPFIQTSVRGGACALGLGVGGAGGTGAFKGTCTCSHEGLCGAAERSQ